MSEGNPFIPDVNDWDKASAHFYGGVAGQKLAPPPIDEESGTVGLGEAKFFKVNTSGSQQTWDTGAVRDSQDGKARYDLIDPNFLARVAEVMRKGAEHYGEFNWTKGIPSQRYMASLLRHIEQYRAGDRSEDHLGAAAFNLMGIMRNEGGDLDDLFNWNGAG